MTFLDVHTAAPPAASSSFVAASRTRRQGSAGRDDLAGMDLAARLMGEAAHDLSSPLTGVRETMRMMCEGQLGPVNDLQQGALCDSVDQCDSMFSLIENMLHLDRLRSGIPAIRREWIAPSDIPKQVRDTLDPISRMRRVRVRWDGFDGTRDPLYGDVQLLRRLLINLIGNAVAVSPEQGIVMVALRPSAIRGTQRLMVADSGPGMAAEDLQRLAARGISETGGMGLGLAIGRALAALHFGQLRILSSPGRGTRVGVELPSGGPASVANALASWREMVADSREHSVRQRGEMERRLLPPGIRVDAPETLSAQATHVTHEGRVPAQGECGTRPADGWSNEDEFMLAFDGAPPRYPGEMCVVALRVDAGCQPSRADSIDKVLQMDQRLHELAYRTDARRWVLMWDNNADEARRRCATLGRQIGGSDGASDLLWSEPSRQSVGDRGDRARLRELLVRDALHASARLPMLDDRQGRQSQQSAPGNSDVSSRRLDEEVRRLGQLLRRQSTRIQRQAQAIHDAMSER